MCKHVSRRVCGKPTSWQPTICTAAETAPRNGLGWMPIRAVWQGETARIGTQNGPHGIAMQQM
jgi:hypothetical protein